MPVSKKGEFKVWTEFWGWKNQEYTESTQYGIHQFHVCIEAAVIVNSFQITSKYSLGNRNFVILPCIAVNHIFHRFILYLTFSYYFS